MQAITFQSPETITLERIPDPEIIHPGDVIVEIKIAGLCGSDLHVYRGHETGLDAGTAMGHEFVGKIVAKGKAVSKWQTGQMVISPFTTNCGRCYYCKIGLTCRCETGNLYGWVKNGEGLHGAQAEYVRVPMADATLLALPEEIPEETGLFLGDILSTGYYCAVQAEVTPDRTYVVLGCGPVGLMATKSLFRLGAEKVIAVDLVPQRLTIARKLGAITFTPDNPELAYTISELTEGRGADAVLEVVGSKAASRLAMDFIRPGGIISTVGVHTSQHFAFSPVEAYDKNLTFRIGRCPARFYMEKLIPEIRQWEIDPNTFITHRLPLIEGKQAYQLFDQKPEQCLKIIFEP